MLVTNNASIITQNTREKNLRGIFIFFLFTIVLKDFYFFPHIFVMLRVIRDYQGLLYQVYASFYGKVNFGNFVTNGTIRTFTAHRYYDKFYLITWYNLIKIRFPYIG